MANDDYRTFHWTHRVRALKRRQRVQIAFSYPLNCLELTIGKARRLRDQLSKRIAELVDTRRK